MFLSLKNLLPQSLRKSGSVRQIEASMITEKAGFVLEELFGKEAASQMKIVSFRNGNLKISCMHSAYAEEITLREKETIAAINARLEAEVVIRIKAS